MFRVMTNGLAWILLGMLFLLVANVPGELADIVVMLVGRIF